MKKSILFFAALCCIVSCLLPQKAAATVVRVCYNGVYYAYSDVDNPDKTVEVTCQYYASDKNFEDNYSGLSGDVVIPSKIAKIYTVTKISNYAFGYKKHGGVFNVTLPSTIEKIENSAFSNATKLYSIRLNEGLKEIGDYIFAGCSALTEVYIPSTLQVIPENAFQKCTSLPAIALSAGIEHIGSEAFFGCTALQSVKSQGGANNVKTIGHYAFYNCSSLYDVRFSNGLTSIGKYAFSDCTKLENLTLPAKLATIGDFAFLNSGLKILTVNWTTPLSVKANVFDGVDLSKCTLYVPAGCKEAYKNADVWKKFGTILEPGEEPVEPITTGQQKIGDLWYDLHEDLTAKLIWHNDNKALTGAIKVPASVTYGAYTYTVNEMEQQVFSDCSQLSEVTLPNTISEIPSYTFYNCTGLTNVTMPSALTSIGSSAFYGCTALTFVSLPASLTEIGANAFWGCDALTSVYIPAGIKTIKEYCFKSCDKLATVTLPDGLTEIEQQAFIGCPALKTITLPASLAKMGNDVFSGKDMVSIRSLRETPPEATEYTFRSMTNKATCILYVPAGTKEAYAAAEGWKDFTDIQEKGDNTKIKYGDLYYHLYDDFTATVIRETLDENNYKSLSGEITVEDKVYHHGQEYKVNKVGSKAFANCKNVTKINLPEIMDAIEAYAFENMNLYEINIPATLERLSYLAFKGSVLFAANMDEQGAVYYDHCLLYHEKDYILGQYKVKEGTRLIASSAFSGDSKISELVMPEGLQCICMGAVDYMPLVNTVTIPSSVYSLQDGFLSSYCEKLKNIYCYLKEPIDVSESPNTFAYWTKEQMALITLYVPYGSRAAYEAADKWKDFSIMEMDPIYTVTFEDYNGFELSSEQVTKGDDATAPDDPTREGYHFTGWDKKFDNVQSDLTVTATYAINAYTVTFRDMNPSVILKTESVNYGDGATAPEAPEHTGYHFLYWTPEYDVITADLDVYAQYEMNTYTVRFQDWDGTELKTLSVDHAHMINLIDMPDESVLTRDCFTFKGWKSSADETLTEEQIAAAEVLQDETYTAYYEINTYQLTFVCEHGTINLIEGAVDPDAVECGTKLHFSVTPDEGYVFDKWSFEYDELEGYEITDNTTITAQMKILTYTVTFVDWDEKELKTETVDWNTAATAPEDPTREGYTFIGWDVDFDHVQGDLTVTALYEEIAKVYFTVTYYDWDMTVLGTEKVEEGKDAKGLESDPEREGYTFTGWNSSLENVTSDLNVQAQYEKQDPTALDEIDWDNNSGMNPDAQNSGANTPAAHTTRKFIENGVLYILRNGILYDAAGNKAQ